MSMMKMSRGYLHGERFLHSTHAFQQICAYAVVPSSIQPWLEHCMLSKIESGPQRC